jgi:arginine-tRNA-protein transferase
MNKDSQPHPKIRLFKTPAHNCSYIQDRQASTIFVDPDLAITKSINTELSGLGFRRSGSHLYRPDCDACKACVSCRIPVKNFPIGNKHRRIIKRNQDLVVVKAKELSCDQSYGLYERYINARHADGDMHPATSDQFKAFIKTGTPDTYFYKLYVKNQLISVSVTDELENGLSAVYTFFEPEEKRRSLGVYSILIQLQKCLENGLPYLFLGYWIKNCQKMEYKADFRPIEFLVEGRWFLAK